MALLDMLQSPQGLLGLSVLGQAERPAQGLLQGLARNQQFQRQGLQQELAKAQILKAQQDAEQRKRQQAQTESILAARQQSLTAPELQGPTQIPGQSLLGQSQFEKDPMGTLQSLLASGDESGFESLLKLVPNKSGKLPTKASLAYEASGGDAKKALELMESGNASLAGNFVLPILSKVVNGKELTEDENKAWDMYTRTGWLEKLMGGMLGGGIGQMPNQITTNQAASPEGSLLSQAREALNKGASREAVEQRLRANNIDPGKL